jgi:predicted dehydrogenase
MTAPASRRRFLAVSTVAGSLVIAGTRTSRAVTGANDRVRIAVLGCNGRGKAHLDGFGGVPGVEIAAVCDPDQRVLDRTLAGLARKAGDRPPATRGERDFRRILDDRSIDAISIATPNHWHSLMTILAAQAGKHVYVEKPLSHDVVEGRVAVAAQRKYGVVVQHGTQRRSNAGIAGLHAALKDGTLPRLEVVAGYCCKPRVGIGTKPDGDPPTTLDWELWKGPAVIERYNPNYVHYNWHWFWKTGNGDLNNQGTHQLDVARWAIDDDQTHPVRVMALGGRFLWNDAGETPNTMFAMAEYPNGQLVLFSVRNVGYEGYRNQICNEYYLEDGSVITGEGTYRIRRPGSDKAEDLPLPPGPVTPGGEWQSFVTAVRAGDPTLANGNVLDAHYGCVLGHLMNNSYRLGSEAPFDAKAGRFGDRADVAEHFERLHAIMRDGVGIPAAGATYRVGPMLSFDPATERHTGDHAEAANALLKDPDTKGFEVPEVGRV